MQSGIWTRGVHGSVRVGFVPNPELTRSHRVGSWTTRYRPLTISGRVGSSSGGQRSGRSKSEWVSTSRSSSNLRWKSLNLRRISPNLRCIFAGSVDFSSDLCDNHWIEARKTTSSPNLNENFHLIGGSSLDLHRICWFFFGSVWQPWDRSKKHHIKPKFDGNFYLIAGSNQKLRNLHQIWVDLGRPGLLSRVSSVGSGSSGFGKGNSPPDLPKSVFHGKDLPPTVIGIESAGFRVGPGDLGKWVGFQFLVDNPNMNSTFKHEQ